MSDSIHIPRKHKTEHDPKMIGLWKIGRTIGKGSSGRVRIARHSKTGQYAAVKIVSKQMVLNSRMSFRNAEGEAERILHGIEREIVIMKLIEHPNIMRLYDVWETSTELFLILEYVEGGELFEYLCNKGRLSTSEALGYFQQIMTAVNYCHRFNIAHRDLKPENLLLDANKNIKVADFGMAAWQGKSDMLQTACGSPHYAAPEVIMGRAYNGACSDVWSCGVILYALLAGRLPFDDEDLATLLEKVKLGKFAIPNGVDPLAKDLIQRMIEKDIHKRITVPEILQHPFYLSQPPKTMSCDIPGLDDIARPLSSEVDIDPDILANLRTLWPGVPDKTLVGNLVNSKQTWEKGVYHLLVRYRAKHLENYDEEEEERLAEKRRGKHARSKKSRRVRMADEDLPPRAGPPTPSRARREEQTITPSTSAGPSRLRQITAIGSSVFTQEHHLIPSPTPPPTQAATPLAPRNANSVAEPSTLPENAQDERIQQFFHQIVDHLNIMQLTKAQRPPPIITERAVPPPPLTLDLGTPFKLRNQRDFASLETHVHQSKRELGTRPLSIRKKERHEVDKENSYADSSYLTVNDGPERKSSVRSNASRDSTRREKHVQLLEPTLHGRPAKLQKKRSVMRGTSPSLSAFSGVSDAGSYFFSSTPKRRWFGNIFRLGPATYTLFSTQDACVTRDECRRILENMGVAVMLLNAEGMGTLKCRLEDMRDPVGIMATVKAVKFRVELKIPQTVQALAGYTVAMNIIMEKGALSSFKLVYNRLRRDWDLDAPPMGRTIDSRTSDVFNGDRFVEVSYS